jgi:hypothetical protein
MTSPQPKRLVLKECATGKGRFTEIQSRDRKGASGVKRKRVLPLRVILRAGHFTGPLTANAP